MSLLPLLFNDFYAQRPSSRMLDQHFGLPVLFDDLHETPRYLTRCPAGYMRNWRSLSNQDTGSTIHVDKDKFQANLDVQQFKPEEISVRVTGDRTITIEGKHEEKEDEHGYISRQFVRKYVLPKSYNIDHVESKLSSDGVLSISAPKIESKAVEHKNIPITHTGQPAKAVKNAQEVDKKSPAVPKACEKK